MQQKHICKTYKKPFNCNVINGLSHTKYTTWRKKPERGWEKRWRKKEDNWRRRLLNWGERGCRKQGILSFWQMRYCCFHVKNDAQFWYVSYPTAFFRPVKRPQKMNKCLQKIASQENSRNHYWGSSFGWHTLCFGWHISLYLMSLTLGWSILYEMDNLGCIDGESSIFICLYSLIKPCPKQSWLPSLWKKDCHLEKVYIPPRVVAVIFLPAMCTKRRKIRILNVTMCLVRPEN